MNFSQSSYEVMEDGGEAAIVIELSKPLSKRFEVMIGLINITARCK